MSPDFLLPRVASGDPNAIRECLDRYGALVWTLARRLSPTTADAEDAVQEIFADVWKSAARFDPGVASETVYVATIARRRLIDRMRARRRKPETEALPEGPAELADPGAPLDADQCAEASLAADAIGRLRPEQRQVLLLAIRHGLSHEEIAAAMKIPLGTVKTLARRGLADVRAWLADPHLQLKAVGP